MPVVDFFFDLSSPYSYLASTQLPALSARTGATVRWRPMVLHAVFRATQNHIPAESPAKARWMLQDLTAWAERYGVPFRMNARFPINAIPTMRLVLVGERYGLAQAVAAEAFRRTWALDLDPTRPEELAAIAAAAGLPEGAVQGIAEPGVKDLLRANTDEAIARGAFGAPALFVDDRLFWGNDRLHMVEEALRGGTAEVESS